MSWWMAWHMCVILNKMAILTMLILPIISMEHISMYLCLSAPLKSDSEFFLYKSFTLLTLFFNIFETHFIFFLIY